VTWAAYGEGLEGRLKDLHGRVHRGAYRARPARRSYIPKGDGEQRPLGIAALEDKIVQQATAWILEQIYEEDFLNFSHGFRPGRSPHNALDALYMGIKVRKVNWILDTDLRRFFDSVQHDWAVRFVEHRVADQRIIRLLRKWLKAGVSEDGQWSSTAEGTPQGAVISPLLANVYLHYVLDLWVQHWRKHHARGDVIVVRFADDAVFGFQHVSDARAFGQALKERLAKFGLSLNEEKTRLIEFGRYAAERRAERELGKPETFDFLGFTHISGRSRKNGRFILKRKTARKRLHAKMKDIRRQLMWHRHKPISEQGAWLRLVLRGYFNYHAIPGNGPALKAIRSDTGRAWLKALRRRGQRDKANWSFMKELMAEWLPPVRIVHPYPDERLAV
jgi:group II intron reverse transcriptase/maturase